MKWSDETALRSNFDGFPHSRSCTVALQCHLANLIGSGASTSTTKSSKAVPTSYCCIYKPPMTSSGVTNMSNFQSDSSIGTAVDCSCSRKLSPTISQKLIYIQKDVTVWYKVNWTYQARVYSFHWLCMKRWSGHNSLSHVRVEKDCGQTLRLKKKIRKENQKKKRYIHNPIKNKIKS